MRQRITELEKSEAKRKRAVEALEETEERLRSYMESSPDSFAFLDSELNYVEINKAGLKSLGKTKEEVIGKNILDINPTLKETGRYDKYLEVIKTGKPFFIDDLIPHPRFGSIHVSVRTFKADDGLGVIVTDITERKKAEEEARRSKEEYIAVANLTGDIIVKVDKEGRWTFLNDSACEFWHKPRKKLLGIKFADYLHPEDAEKTNVVVQELIKTKNIVRGLTNRQKTPKGWRTVEWNAAPIFDEAGNYTGMQVTGRDITARKEKVEDALKESEEKFRTFMETASDLIHIADKDAYLTYVNKATARVLGYSKEEMVGMHITQILSKEIKEIFKPKFEELITNGEISFESTWITKDGKEIYGETKIVAIYDSDGKYAGSRGVCRDITESKRAEKEIKASLKEKEVLLREIHHRVNNNLQIISSLLKLQSQYFKDKQYVEMFKESQNRIKSMAFIHEKLYQSKDLAKINFKKYIKTLANSLIQSYKFSPGKIALKIEAEDVSLGIDNAIPCGLILNELVTNSLKHAFPDGKEGKIKIALHPVNEKDIELVISDDGVGIPEDLDFRKTKSLGLHLVTILAEDQLHGEIKLDRTKGTKFQIKLRGVK